MVESNPGMSIDDIIACIDESKKQEFQAPQLFDFGHEEFSSDPAACELDEKDIEAMNNLISPILASTESDISPEQEKSLEEKKLSEEEVSGREIYGGERSSSPGTDPD